MSSRLASAPDRVNASFATSRTRSRFRSYFPQISLSGFLGGQSTQLALSGPNSAWSLVPQITQPIFTAGRIRSGVRLAGAERQSPLIQYEKTIQTAFTEVSDALIAHRRSRESRVEQGALVTALRDRTRLAYVRYQGGRC